jgi:hypothetical protein
MALKSLAQPGTTRPIPTTSESDLLALFRRLAPDERDTPLRLAAQIERAADRQPERLRVH